MLDIRFTRMRTDVFSCLLLGQLRLPAHVTVKLQSICEVLEICSSFRVYAAEADVVKP